MNIPPFSLILTAAGSSSRFLRDAENQIVKKEFLTIDGHTVLYRALEPFYELGSLANVVITYEKDSLDETVVALEDLIDINAIPMFFVEGGKTRTESIRNALKKLQQTAPETQYVAIHDGARPYISPHLIIKTFANATVYGASVPGLRITDSMKRIDEMGLIKEDIDRDGAVRVQTPQFFTFPFLVSAYEKIKTNETDDSSLYVKAGYRCHITITDEENSKITYLDDIPNANEQIKEYVRIRDEGRKSAEAVRRFRALSLKRDDK